MFNNLPTNALDFKTWGWSQIEPYYQDLVDRPLDAGNITAWLLDWTRLSDLISEVYARMSVAVTMDTTDQEAEKCYHAFLDAIHPAAQAANQKLKEKLLASELEPEGFEIPLRRMRTEAEIFHSDNLPLISEEHKLASEYNKIIGAQTVAWQGEELTMQQMRKAIQNPDRHERERVWRLASDRQLADRQAINELWGRFLHLRGQMSANAGITDYRAFRWKQMLRLDYSPEDCTRFQKAIEKVAVPAATRVYERYQRRLGVDRLRPWDLDSDLYPIELPPMPGYGKVEDLPGKTQAIFQQLDPGLGEYFAIMRTEGLLDLENRKGKAPGGYCTGFPVARRPFIFMNAVGLGSDVVTILHEAGHAFHNYERFKLPYAQQRIPGLEFAEVASMAMELLCMPYLADERVGFYGAADARRFRHVHLERILTFWPYMAVVDAFQHWVYTHQEEGRDPANCDAAWLNCWERFMPGVDWSDLEQAAMTGWHRKQHIFRYPFYYVEYGLAQLGAIQIWRNSLDDPGKALDAYRTALRLGGTRALPELYQAAGANLAFDEEALDQAVQLIEEHLLTLE